MHWSFMSELKSPIKVVYKWLLMWSLWGLYEQQTNHFLFHKFISTIKHSAGKGSTEQNSRIPPQLMFLSILKGSQKPLIWNWSFAKLLSVFVSKIISRLKLLVISFVMNSNLFLIELMLKWAKISLLKFLLQTDFKWLISVRNFFAIRFISREITTTSNLSISAP